MNKIGKTAMMMGAGMLMGATYYMMLPEEKKQSLKNNVSKKLNIDKEIMTDLTM